MIWNHQEKELKLSNIFEMNLEINTRAAGTPTTSVPSRVKTLQRKSTYLSSYTACALQASWVQMLCWGISSTHVN